MAAKMKSVRQKLEIISKQRHEFSFTAGNSCYELKTIDERETSSVVIEEADILGRDQAKQKVITLLTEANTSSGFIILPIYGIGGIGKTTLAQLVFNDTHFNDYDKAWVYVSQIFDLTKICNSIRSQLSQLQKEQSQLTDTQELDANPPALKKVLIVLDDMWENSDFKVDKLKGFLKALCNGGNVHVIVTTRDAAIAKKIQTLEAYPIELLSSDMCWTIIKQQIVGFEDWADKERLEDIGKEIAIKCGGVALAARALGYLLRYRPDFDGWVSVKDSAIWNVPTPGYTRSPSDDVFASLKLSYSSMVPYLRQCFAYCAIFPKGHRMSKDDLIYQWVALGFIEPSNNGVSAWQHGESFIKQLLGMSFLQHSKTPSYEEHGKNVTLFTMHDLVHDLARSIMGDEVLDATIEYNTRGTNCRYVSLADCGTKPLNSFVTYPNKIRALCFLRSVKIGHGTARFSTAKYLRVLDLGECSILNLPTFICQLKLLRYLSAPGIKDRMIPSCITKLSKLIYLNLRESSEILALPESIGEMEDLKHLDLSGCPKIRELPKSFEKLKNLVHLDISKCSDIRVVSNSLENLTQLKYLNLSGCKLSKELPRSLGMHRNLVHLDLSDCYEVNCISEALCSLTKLRYLNLSRAQKWMSCGPDLIFSEDIAAPLPGLTEVIGKLIELRYLNLSNCMYGPRINITEGEENSTPVRGENSSPVGSFPDTRISEGEETPVRGENSSPVGSFPDTRISEGEENSYPYFQRKKNSYPVSSFLDTISSLSNLEHLDLSYNIGIYTIPESFCSLSKLHTLEVTWCHDLERLPENIADMDTLKFLFVKNCWQLDMSNLQRNKHLIPLPKFVVHAAGGEQSSNLLLLKDVSPPELELCLLENVKSLEEARKIKLRDKQSMRKLTLGWTIGKKGFVEDMELLRELAPPSSLEEFELHGYNNVTFPVWLMDIAMYLPNLVSVRLMDVSQCSSLPPLGQLPNLVSLRLVAVSGITKIDRGFCGGLKAFVRLEDFSMFSMESLQEWTTAYSDGEDGVADEFMFPNLENLEICRCHKLRLNPCPPRVRGTWRITESDRVLSQWGESSVHTGSSTSSASLPSLFIESSMLPVHQWKLLRHLPAVEELIIKSCDDLNSSSDIVGVSRSLRDLILVDCDRMTSLPQWLGQLTTLKDLRIRGCKSLNNLPEWLGDLVSLNDLNIYDCKGIVSLPESIQRLTNLKSLSMPDCPALQQWCKLEENKKKIRHIKEVESHDKKDESPNRYTFQYEQRNRML